MALPVTSAAREPFDDLAGEGQEVQGEVVDVQALVIEVHPGLSVVSRSGCLFSGTGTGTLRVSEKTRCELRDAIWAPRPLTQNHYFKSAQQRVPVE
ncbi:MAG TPA: hypothetical protein VER96_28475 [Polyangiaceae bacterium]|nr:hypothetical protein [Polyangiaceae bacterium]